MENKIAEVRPSGWESWVLPDINAKEAKAVRPVPRSEGSSFRTINREPERQRSEVPSMSREELGEVARNIQRYLSDLNISVTFEIHDETGELVTRVVNRDTREVIRQFPPEDLLKLHEKLEELRGILFNGRA